MKLDRVILFLWIPILFAVETLAGSSIPQKFDRKSLKASQFPPDFLFGAAVAAYQTEGAAMEDGRGLSIWDEFSHKHPEKIIDKTNGDIAADSYNFYKKDIAMLKQMGMKAYRFSISWTRILPNGKLSGRVNQKGVQHYNEVINEVIAQGLIPFVTLVHFDPPQALEDEYGGFLSKQIVNDFRDFADVCFKEYGDRVKHWITINEPLTFVYGGYASGGMAPGRCTTAGEKQKCDEGNSAVEPYLAAHNQLLAHAAAVTLYRKKYQATQKGMISIVLNTDWFIPYTSSKEDIDAAQRALEFCLGWFMDPVTKGDYPKIMKDIVGDRLPTFTPEESELLKGSLDFLGLNYYTSRYASNYAGPPRLQSYTTDVNVNFTTERDGKLIGPPTAAFWLCVYPEGLKNVLLYIKDKYNNPLIYIAENGVPDDGKLDSKGGEPPADQFRIDALSGHLSYINMAIKEGSNVKGYMAWSLIDSYEWQSGFTTPFGLHYINFSNPSIRIPKQSALWFKEFLSH